MTIGVQSYPELYTILIGWQLYDEFWNVLSQTGIAFAPFIFIIIRNIAQPYASQEPKDATTTSLRRMELQLFGTLLLIFFCVAPFMTLTPTMVSYTPTCQTNGASNTATPGNTQTTWDNAFTVPTQTIQVPIWWYAIVSLSEGMTSAANTLIKCTPDLRSMVTQVDMTQINDPALKNELQQFAQDCYVPAKTQYLKDEQNNGSNLPTINNDRQQYGQDDTEWLGSHSFQDTYYQNLTAGSPVQGFPYVAAQDINSQNDQSNPPSFGTPNCATWWNDPTNGLKTKLNNQLPTIFWSQFQSFFNNNTNQQDGALKRMLTNENTGYQSASNTINDASYSHAAEGLGTYLTSLTAYPKIYATAQSAPIIQAILLLMVYAFLPFALIFTGYKPSSFIAGSIIIFSLIFWSFIWHLVTYVDSTLMNALYGSDWFDQLSPTAILADIITGLLIIVAPLFWFSFMGAMGVAVGDLVSRSFHSLNSVGDSASQEGSGLIKSGVKSLSRLI